MEIINWRKSLTLKLSIFFGLFWTLTSIFDFNGFILTGGIEDVWDGKFWLPLTDWLTVPTIALKIASLYAFWFFGLNAERRFGQKEFAWFVFSAHSISVLVNLFMLQNLGGGISGLVWALIAVYLIPPRYRMKRGIFLRLFVFLICFQVFSILLLEFSITRQIPHLFQCTMGVSVGMLYLLIGRLGTHKQRQMFLIVISLFLWAFSLYNPFHYLWPVYQIDKAYEANPIEGAETVKTALKEGNGKTRIELAWRILKGKFEGIEEEVALETLQEGDPNDLYTAIVLSEYFLSAEEPSKRQDSLALKYLNYLPDDKLIDVANSKATILCGSPNAELRNVNKGLTLSEKSNEKTSWQSPVYLDTYAACLSQKGDFKQAEKWLNRALLLQDSSDQKTLKVLQENLNRVKLQYPITYPLEPLPESTGDSL